MKLTRVENLLNEIANYEIPISNTTRGEQIQQTYRNNLTAKLKAALFEDCNESLAGTEIYTFLTKDGVILEIPNESIANGITNDLGSGAISIEMKFTIKGLEYNATDESEDYELSVAEKRQKAAEAEKKKADKIARDRKAREEREAKRARIAEASGRVIRRED